MRKIVFLVAFAFAASALAGLSQKEAFAVEYKIGYVDMAKVFAEYNKTKESEKSLEEKGRAKEADRKKLVDELKKLKDEQALLAEKAKNEKQAVIDQKIKILQDFDRQTRDDLIKERNDKLGGILKDIEKVTSDYAKEQTYDIVMDSRMILYGVEKYDLTAEVLKRLNK